MSGTNSDSRHSLARALQAHDADSAPAVRRLHKAIRHTQREAAALVGNATENTSLDSSKTNDDAQVTAKKVWDEDTSASLAFANLPERRLRLGWRALASFCLCVCMPTLLAAVYYLAIASDQYAVEWHYTIQDANRPSAAAPTGISSLFGVSSGADTVQNYIVADYIVSKQAVLDLQKKIDLRSLYSKPSIDYLSRVKESLPPQKFEHYWRRLTSASFDQVTGIAVAQVRAFSPEDAYLIAETLVQLSEDLLTRTSQRPLLEAVKYAESEVALAQERLQKVRRELTEYRNNAAVIDPTSNVVLSNAAVASGLRQTIAQLQAELGSAVRGGLSANSSTVEALKRRIAATQTQLREVEAQVAQPRDGSRPISEIVAKYEELEIERQFAQSVVMSTLQVLEQARVNAMEKRLFIVPYVKPEMPQVSTYPTRAINIGIVAGLSTLLWAVGLLLYRSISDHAA